MEGHTGPVLRVICIDPKDLHLRSPPDNDEEESKVVEEPKILSCSLDNTIRFWDGKDMSVISVMENDERSELSSMCYLPSCGLVVTGHEDGHIRIWNLEIGNSVLLTTNSTLRHKSTVSCVTGVRF